MGTKPAILECAPLIDDVLDALDEADAMSWREKALRAAGFLKQAMARGATATAAYWKEKYKNALAQGKKAEPASKEPAASDDGPEITIEPGDEPPPDAKKQKDANPFAPPGDGTAKSDDTDAAKPAASGGANPFAPPEADTKSADDAKADDAKADDAKADDAKADDAKADDAKADDAKADDAKADDAKADDAKADDAKADDAKANDALPPEEQTVDDDAQDVDVDGLSEDEAALVQNKKHRERVGKEAAAEVDGKRKGILSGIGSLLGGIAGAVGSVGNWLAGGLSSLDSKTLGKAAGTMIFAALGGLAFGGVGALAGMALAQYFASKASSSREEGVQFDVHRAFALAEKKDSTQAGQEQWANHVLDAVKQGFENLGDMDPKEMAAILKAAKRFKKDLLPPAKKDA